MLKQFVKEAVRTLFFYEENAKINLFETFPGLKRFIADRKNFRNIRTVGDVLFTAIILLGLFGPQDPERNIALFIAWGVWWTSVVLSWFFVGKLWCGFCPFPGIGRIFQRFGISLNLEVPEFLKSKSIHLSMILLGLIIWIEAIADLKERPEGTALLLMGIVLGATLFEVVFKGQAWCRYACPMGKIIGTASVIAVTEFRPDLAVCRTCTSIACKKGAGGGPGCPVYLGAVSVRNNVDCLVCGHCVALCDKDSPRINLRNPFVELVVNKGRYVTCSYIIPFLMGSQIARFIQERPWYGQIQTMFFDSDIIAFTLLLIVGFALFWGVIRVGARLFTVTEDEVFGRFSPMVPVLIPLAFTGELAYRFRYFMRHVGDFLPTFGRQFGLSLEGAGFSVPEGLLTAAGYILFAVGAAAGGHVLYVFNRDDFEGVIPKANYLTLYGLVLSVFVGYAVLI